jgi:ABC-type uncharacterized transport system ATPase subunit
MTRVALRVAGIGVAYGPLVAVREASIEIADTGIHALIGPNGSGKSSLLKAIAGLVGAFSGELFLGTERITRWSPLKRANAGISLKFQVPQTFADLTVTEHIEVASRASLRGRLERSAAPVDAGWENFLRACGLGDRLRTPARELSHGHLQCLEMLTCLIQQPRFLLLDEPTAGLSPSERRLTGEQLQSLARNFAVVLVEHDLDFVRSIAGTVTVMHQGQVVASGTVDQIQADPAVRQIYVSRL